MSRPAPDRSPVLTVRSARKRTLPPGRTQRAGLPRRFAGDARAQGGRPAKDLGTAQPLPLVTARRHLLFAGGIGVTPLLAMTHQLDAEGGDYTLHYCARSRTHAAFVPELTDNPHAAFHFDDEDPAQMLDMARDLGEPQPDTAVYVCGPAGFIDHVLGKAEAIGWPPQVLHKERFSNDRATAQRDADGSGGFTIRLASTGAEYLVPGGSSVLDILLENDVDAPHSCQLGICGECVVRVLAGDPDHRDDVLTPDERAEGMFATCSSRSLSPTLELDL